MTHQVLLVSRDPDLAQRVGRALPAAIPNELHCAPHYREPADPRGWLLLLLDAHAASGAAAAAASPAGPPCGPILWLGDAPLVTQGAPGPQGPWPGLPGRVVDYLDRRLAPSKLAFILHQHLAAAYLHRMRSLPPPLAADGGALRSEINNALTGILGNAELALAASRRLPAPLGLRLQRISELAARMRDLVVALPDPDGPAGNPA